MSKQLLLSGALGLAVLLQSCSQANSHGSDSYTTEVEAPRPKTAAELRAELLQREQAAPETYVQVEGKHWRNLIDELVLEGDITNQATLARYKDPVLSVTWYSKTGTELETQHYQIYELVRPQGSAHFKLKTNAPSYVATVALGIASATPID